MPTQQVVSIGALLGRMRLGASRLASTPEVIAVGAPVLHPTLTLTTASPTLTLTTTQPQLAVTVTQPVLTLVGAT